MIQQLQDELERSKTRLVELGEQGRSGGDFVDCNAARQSSNANDPQQGYIKELECKVKRHAAQRDQLIAVVNRQEALLRKNECVQSNHRYSSVHHSPSEDYCMQDKDFDMVIYSLHFIGNVKNNDVYINHFLCITNITENFNLNLYLLRIMINVNYYCL